MTAETGDKRLDLSADSVFLMRRESRSEQPEEPRGAADFLEREVGGELRCSRKVADLLHKLREENSGLEEQVNPENTENTQNTEDTEKH